MDTAPRAPRTTDAGPEAEVAVAEGSGRVGACWALGPCLAAAPMGDTRWARPLPPPPPAGAWASPEGRA